MANTRMDEEVEAMTRDVSLQAEQTLLSARYDEIRTEAKKLLGDSFQDTLAIIEKFRNHVDKLISRTPPQPGTGAAAAAPSCYDPLLLATLTDAGKIIASYQKLLHTMEREDVKFRQSTIRRLISHINSEQVQLY